MSEGKCSQVVRNGAGPGVEVTVLVAKSEVLNYNNLSKSKEDAIKGEECGEEKNRERSNWQPGEQGPMREREREREAKWKNQTKSWKLGIPLKGTSSTALKPTNWTALL